jgi:hypothetical protein
MPVGVVEVTQQGTGRLLWRVAVGNGSQVDLDYTNARYNAPTTQRYVVTDGLLRLAEISSTSREVLVFLVLEPPYEQRDGRLVSRRHGPSFADLTVRIGQTEQQRLVVDGRELPLYRAGAGEGLRIAMSRMSRVLVWLQRSRSP